MNRLPLDVIARHLSEQLRFEQDDLCLQILQQVTRGKPVAKAELGARLKFSQDELEQRLTHVPDTEFDQQGNILGWGVTMLPTRHRFQIRGKPLFTWCAFDTVLFPPTLVETAQVHSTCPVTGQLITFVAMPEGKVLELTPAEARMSLIIPAERSECVRASFCERSLFFWSEQAALPFLAAHPEALLLSIEEAATVGKLVAESRFIKKQEEKNM